MHISMCSTGFSEYPWGNSGDGIHFELCCNLGSCWFLALLGFEPSLQKKYLENNLNISQVAACIFKMFPQRFFKGFPFPTNYSLYSTQGISLGNVSGKVCCWKSWSFQYKKVLRETFWYSTFGSNLTIVYSTIEATCQYSTNWWTVLQQYVEQCE